MKINRQLIITEDGSHTIYLPGMKETYHSVHGAIQESKHVFIDSGFKHLQKKGLSILEIGLGTGLNAFLTLLETETSERIVNYFGIEKYPLTPDEYKILNYSSLMGECHREKFLKLHETDWVKCHSVTPAFRLQKIHNDFRKVDLSLYPSFDLIYFDAFAPNKHPDLWEPGIYRKIFSRCNAGAVLVTYCAKGMVRREMENAGFMVDRIPGPPGKNEMLRAIK